MIAPLPNPLPDEARECTFFSRTEGGEETTVRRPPPGRSGRRGGGLFYICPAQFACDAARDAVRRLS